MPDDAPLLLDVTRLIWRRWKGRLPTGIDRVCLAYLRHFGERSQAVVHHKHFRRILGTQASQDLFALLEGAPRQFRARLPQGILRHLSGLNGKGHGRLYLNVGHTGLDSPGFRDWLLRSQVRPVYLVHDLIPITHRQFCRSGEDERHRQRMLTVLETAAGVIGNSRATLDELERFAIDAKLEVPPSISAWLGSDPLPSLPAAHRTQRPTFITLGTIEGRKNHLLLLNIWSRLVDRLGLDTPQLLIIGQRGWQAQPVFDLLDHSEKLKGHVIELDRCTDEELAKYLASTRALLFPSLAEGYGLPLIEALAEGVPVIASNLPVFQELSADIPTYLDPLDESAWECAIIDYAASNSPAREAQLRRMKGFRSPSWQEHFAIVDDWLKTLG